MFDAYLKPMIERYERVFTARLLFYAVLFGGSLILSILVCVGLLFTFPDYRWHIILGIFMVWLIKLACFYGHMRVVIAEQNAQLAAEQQQLNQTLGLVTSTVTLFMDLMHQFKKKK